MKVKVLCASLVVTSFIVSAVAHLPARLALSYLPSHTGLQIDGVSGTVWNGQASSVYWQQYSLGEVNWQWSPMALLSGDLEAQVRLGRGSTTGLSGRGHLGMSFSGPYVSQFIASVPVETIVALLPPSPIPLDLDGQAELNLRHWHYQSPLCHSGEGSLVLNIQEIGTPITQLNTGPLISDIRCNESQVMAKGQQSSDQVTSGFELTLEPDQSYQVAAWFKPESQFPGPLGDQLNWLTSAKQGERYQFSYQGQW